MSDEHACYRGDMIPKNKTFGKGKRIAWLWSSGRCFSIDRLRRAMNFMIFSSLHSMKGKGKGKGVIQRTPSKPEC